MPVAGDPLKPCPVDSLNGYHDWVAMDQKGTGDPLPGARYCVACGAMDVGPNGLRLNHKDNPSPVFPAATRSFREVVSHNPDDPGFISTTTEETY